jgi:hypothetical protein
VGWYFVDRALESFGLNALVLLSATAMGTQAVIARHINAPGINTIVFTSTFVSDCRFDFVALGEIMLRFDPGEGRIRTARQIGIFLAYALGGLLAAVFIWHGAGITQWVPLLAVAGAVGCFELGEQPPATS